MVAEKSCNLEQAFLENKEVESGEPVQTNITKVIPIGKTQDDPMVHEKLQKNNEQS